MKHAAILAAAALTLAACATTAPPAPPPENSADYFAKDFACSARTAVTADLASVIAAPMRYDGKCLDLYGFAKGSTLYRDANAALKSGAPALALAFHDTTLAHRLTIGPSFVHLTGRARSCSHRRALAAAASPPRALAACRHGAVALFVSQASIVPTAMD